MFSMDSLDMSSSFSEGRQLTQTLGCGTLGEVVDGGDAVSVSIFNPQGIPWTYMTTRLPVLSTAKPPSSTPWRPEMALTNGGSPTTLMSFSPAYRSWYSWRISREVISLLRGMLMVKVIPRNHLFDLLAFTFVALICKSSLTQQHEGRKQPGDSVVWKFRARGYVR